MSNMYEDTITWNPFKGCKFDCVYCKPSFKAQAKRQKHNCIKCYNYEPHFHPERLKQYLPKNKLIFVCGNGDIAFAKSNWVLKILDEIELRKDNTFLLQTKKPSFLLDYEYIIPSNCIVGTTIETNRDTKDISLAPHPIDRYYSLNDIKHKRKFITHEPLIDFDLKEMVKFDKGIKPEIIWIGYNSRPKQVLLDEPKLSKTKELIKELKTFTDVRLKTIRNKKKERKHE